MKPKNLRDLRLSLSPPLTLKEAAARIGRRVRCGESMLSMVERRQRRASPFLIAAIAAVYGVSVAEIRRLSRRASAKRYIRKPAA
jgi:hypothetical protein